MPLPVPTSRKVAQWALGAVRGRVRRMRRRFHSISMTSRVCMWVMRQLSRRIRKFELFSGG